MNWKFWKKRKKDALDRVRAVEIAHRSLRLDFDRFVHGVSANINNMKKEVGGVKDQSKKTMSIVQQILLYQGDAETKIEALKTLLIRNDVIAGPEDYERAWDEIKMLRVRSKSESIEHGDFVMLDYEVKDKETRKLIAKDKEFNLRVGSKQLFFEDKLIGRKVGDSMVSFEMKMPKESSHADKTVLCNIWPKKVKARLKGPKSESIN